MTIQIFTFKRRAFQPPKDLGSIPESEGSPRGGHHNPLQYSCLENSIDRGVW